MYVGKLHKFKFLGSMQELSKGHLLLKEWIGSASDFKVIVNPYCTGVYLAFIESLERKTQ